MSSDFEKFLGSMFETAKKAGAQMVRLDSGDIGALFAEYQKSGSPQDCEKDEPQAPLEFRHSDGLIGVFQLKPREVSAI